MSPDRQDLQNRFAAMPTKQKVTIGLTIVVVAVVIWQVMGLFGGSSKSTAPVVPAKTTVMTSKTVTTSNGGAPQQMAMSNNAAQNGFMAQPQEVPPPRQVPVQPTVDQTLMNLQKEAQDKYIAQTAQLQNLKLEQQIAETNSAIAQAKLTTFTSEKAISDMLSAGTPGPLSPSAYGSLMAGAAPTSPPSAAPAAVPAVPSVSTTTTITTKPVAYTLVSVSMQLSRWMAVIGYGDKLYTVSIGDKLPPDGSVVESINKYAVELLKDGKITKVSLVPEI